MRALSIALPWLLALTLVAFVSAGLIETRRLLDTFGPHSCSLDAEVIELRHDNARLRQEVALRGRYIDLIERYWPRDRRELPNLLSIARARGWTPNGN